MGGDLSRGRDLIVLDGSTFFFSDVRGDVEAEEAEGYFHDDVRHLSRWLLSVEGEELQAITSRTVDYYSARIVLAPAAQNPQFSVRRDRFVTEGVHEDVVVENHHAEPLRLSLELGFAADFADIMEAQDGREQLRGRLEATPDHDERTVTLDYGRDGFH